MDVQVARTSEEAPRRAARQLDAHHLQDVSLQVGRSLDAAVRAQRAAARTCNTVLDTRRRTRQTVEDSQRLRVEFRQARAARDAHRRSVGERRLAGGVLAALQEAADRLTVLAEAAGHAPVEDGLASGTGARQVSVVSAASPGVVLTARQLEILAMVAEGQTTERIARELWLSVATVRNHVARTLRALDAHSRVEAIAKARRMGLL